MITVLWAYHNYTEAAVAVGGKVAPTSLANLGARTHTDRGYAQIDLDAGWFYFHNRRPFRELVSRHLPGDRRLL